MAEAGKPGSEVLIAQRDLYRSLLELQTEREMAPLLRQALDLIVAATEARRGYLEIADSADDSARWSLAEGFSDAEVELVRSRVSRGIIAAAVATGQTQETASAVHDPKHRERASVLENRIQAVLCAPLGQPPVGVLYLEGAAERGAFRAEHRELVEAFARHLAPVASRITAEVRRRRDDDPTRRLRRKLDVAGLVGRSRAFATVLEGVSIAAPLDVTVLLTGDTGSGKTVIARAIHDNSPRRSGPFVVLNCAAFPDTLIESELFGVVAGAHSTANRDRVGHLKMADKGTLFLDEIGELSLVAQAKLLQFLDSRTFLPLGSSKPQRADTRVIAATHRDLEAMIGAREFRADLHFRLRVMPLRVPSLNERGDDLREIAEASCTTISRRYGLPALSLSPGGMAALEAREWPGNVRELEHVIEQAAIHAAHAGYRVIERHHLFRDEERATGPASVTWQEQTRDFQQQLLVQTLEDLEWNVSEAARRLDLTRAHVYNLIHAFGLKRRRAR